MHALMLGVALGLVGLEHGWQPAPRGGAEFIIQIAPQEIDIFKQEKEIIADIPSKLKDIRTVRVVVGVERLPQVDPPTPPPPPPTSAPYAPDAFNRQSSWLQRLLGSKSDTWLPYQFARPSTAIDQGRQPIAKQPPATRSPSEAKIEDKAKKDEAKKTEQKTNQAKAAAPQPPWKLGWPFAVTLLLFVSAGGNL